MNRSVLHVVLVSCGIFLKKGVFFYSKNFSGIESLADSENGVFSRLSLPIWCWFTIKSFFLISEKQLICSNQSF
jgi:hypothetical protein